MSETRTYKGKFVSTELSVEEFISENIHVLPKYYIEAEQVEYAHKEMRYEYYVKFAIGKTGKLLLLVSCHLSR